MTILRSRLFRLVAAATAAAALASPVLAAECRMRIPAAARAGALQDMALPSEAIPPNGKEGAYDWMRKSKMASGNQPGQMRTILPWFVLMDGPGNRVPQARVEFANPRLLILSRRSGQWHVVPQSGTLGGGLFANDITTQVGPLEFSQGSGGSSSLVTDAQHVAHFWTARETIDPDDVAGVFVSIDARMDSADHAAGARYLLDAGADYWLDKTALFHGWDAKPRVVEGVATGRMKRVTPQWRTYAMTTADAEMLGRCVAVE